MKVLIRSRLRRRHLDRSRIIRISRNILSRLDQEKSELSILLVGDKTMAQLNRAYRGVNRSTDVLSFDAAVPVGRGEGAHILGDIVISIPTAEAQAKKYGSDLYDEINRLLIHGILHLLGYDHERSGRQARLMREKEEEVFLATQEMD